MSAASALLATAGILFVLYLVSMELVKVQRICEWCTAAQVLAFALFVLSLRDAQQIGKGLADADD